MGPVRRSARCRTLLLELATAEHTASRLPRREAQRLGDVPPAHALRAVAAHADESRDELDDLARARRVSGSTWDLAARALRHLADEAAAVHLDDERRYRRALLALRRGLDAGHALRVAAAHADDTALLVMCDRWLAVRLRLVAGVEAELAWFGRGSTRRTSQRARLLVSAIAAGALACSEGPALFGWTDATPGETVPPPRQDAPAPAEGPRHTCPSPDAPPCTSASGDAGAEGGAPPPFLYVDINHVLSTGQSNSVANDGKPVLSKTQPYANVMFDVGVMTGSQCDGDGCRRYDTPSSFVPLVEYFGKVYARVILERRPWEPLRPIAIARNGDRLTVRYAVPSPPLVIDTEAVKDPGDRGFELVDAAGARLPIASVEVTAPDTVTITMGGQSATAARLRYAYAFTGCGGSGTVARGNLRDSDATPSAHGYRLWNWSVHFDGPIP